MNITKKRKKKIQLRAILTIQEKLFQHRAMTLSQLRINHMKISTL